MSLILEYYVIETASWVNANRITLVGDRGMRIRMNLEDMGEEQRQGIYYISALTKTRDIGFSGK